MTISEQLSPDEILELIGRPEAPWWFEYMNADDPWGIFYGVEGHERHLDVVESGMLAGDFVCSDGDVLIRVWCGMDVLWTHPRLEANESKMKYTVTVTVNGVRQ